MELVFRAFLLWFTIYTLSVCPQDEHLKSPVCRGLAEYRRLVIEPYILPSIEHALAHPSVAPYVEKAKPYADYAVRTAKPIAARAQKEFDTRVVPQWKKRVVPFYYQHAVPQLLKLDAQTAPYRTRVEQDYERLVAPYVRRIVAALNQGQRKARPYVALAAEKSYQGYQHARPYARPVWEKVKAILAQLAAILGEQRRQFVDPHVKKIWEHVKEMSNGKPQSPSASQLRNAASSKLSKASSQISQASAKISSTLSSVTSSPASRSSAKSSSAMSSDNVVSSVISEAVSSSEALAVVQATEVVKSSVAVAADKVSDAASSVSDAVESTASAVSSSASSAISSASDTVAASSSSLASAASSAVHTSAESASSVAEAVTSVVSTLAESASTAVFDAPSEAGSALSSEATSLADEAGSSASSGNLISSSAADVASVTAADADASGSEAAESTPSVVAYSEEQTSADVATDASSDPDLDLLAELGLTEDFLEGRDTGEAPVQHEQTEEEREEELRLRKEKNARDRAALLERHVAWEVKVEDLIAENKKAVHDLIVASRKAALTELKLSVEIAKEIEGLVEDADKFLRGAEKYMANLQKESRKQDEKRTVWDRVVGKLEDKFSDRLRQTEGVVNGWYQSLLEKEAAEIKKLTTAVKDLAERAQADIGLDYAYLDDVSYADWQRYHDLLRRADNFTTYANSIQDGTHESAPPNPVGGALQELQDEVEDVINGFNARLRQIKRNGARTFGVSEAAAEEEDGPASILPIEEPEQTESPADDTAAKIPPVVIGRGKEEVEAALNRVADLEGQKTSSPDEPAKNQDADAVAQSIQDAVASEESSASSPLHEEL
ncbi:hypothetical protein C8Q76DRAFT_612860 [Earliella scabrosa]|nr:hypothetical protein C8Q76DRAFT_612860 [Earliella scabrosa]